MVIDGSKNERFYAVPIGVSGLNRRQMVVGSYVDIANPTVERQASDIVTGQFNGDSQWDVALVDEISGKLIIIRQQPPPCATYIAAAAHGMITNNVA